MHITVIPSDKEQRFSIPYCQYLICNDMSLTCYWEMTKAWFIERPPLLYAIIFGKKPRLVFRLIRCNIKVRYLCYLFL